jgi:uncharacterized protein (TIGR03790 family)
MKFLTSLTSLSVLVASFALLALPAAALAQSAENVAVVINDASPASQKIADHYIKKRGIPAGNVIHLHTATTDDISRAVFGATIETPIAAAIAKANLQDRILYIVLTKDIPLRVDGTSGPQGTVASVDSELSLLYRKMTGRPVTITGRVDNPYFLGLKNVAEARPFTHAQFDVFLVTRLDAFTVDEAIALIDKASAPSTDGKVVLDEKNFLFNRSGEGWLEEAASRLRGMGQGDRVVLDQTTTGVRGVSPVIGYYSWGSNDPANRVRKYNMGLVAGSIVGTFVSSDARTFHEPPADWVPSDDWNDRSKQFAGTPQSLVGDLIREGATGAAGHVAEPYLESTVHPNILFPVYLAGFNLAESYYLAIPHLSWQTVVIGDPLCRPFSGTVLAHANIEAPDDPATELPGYFSKRKLEVAQARLGFPSPEAQALGVKAETRLEKGDRAGARKALEQAIAADPGFVTGKFLLAQLVEADGDHDAAIELYRKVILAEPNNAVALNNLAYALAINKHQPQEAKPLADRAAALSPREPTILDTDAWIQHLLANHPEAARLIAVAVNGAPGNAEIRLHAAFIYESSGAVAAARVELDAATKLDPSLNSKDDVKELRRRLEKK